MLVFNQVKKQLGLDQCVYFLFGAAPLDPQIRHYFLSLNFFLINSYGMS
jgi:long-chain-fatty-acid--CoA ligase ACSBG